MAKNRASEKGLVHCHKTRLNFLRVTLFLFSVLLSKRDFPEIQMNFCSINIFREIFPTVAFFFRDLPEQFLETFYTFFVKDRALNKLTKKSIPFVGVKKSYTRYLKEAARPTLRVISHTHLRDKYSWFVHSKRVTSMIWTSNNTKS